MLAWRICSWAEVRLGRSRSPAKRSPRAKAKATSPPNLSQFREREDIERSFEKTLRSCCTGDNLTLPAGRTVSFGQYAVTLSAAKGPTLFRPLHFVQRDRRRLVGLALISSRLRSRSRPRRRPPEPLRPVARPRPQPRWAGPGRRLAGPLPPRPGTAKHRQPSTPG